MRRFSVAKVDAMTYHSMRYHKTDFNVSPNYVSYDIELRTMESEFTRENGM